MRALFPLPRLVAAGRTICEPKFLDAHPIPCWPAWVNLVVMLSIYNCFAIGLPALALQWFAGLSFMPAFGLTTATLLFHLALKGTLPGIVRIHRAGVESIEWNGRGSGWITHATSCGHHLAFGIIRTVCVQISYLVQVSLLALMAYVWLGGFTVPSGTTPITLIQDGFAVAAASPGHLIVFAVLGCALPAIVRTLR